MGAYNFGFTGTPDQVSQAFNNYINGWIGIQPDQGILQGLGTVIGNQLNANTALAAHVPTQQVALVVRGESDKNNMRVSVQLFNQPAGNAYATGPLNP
jgi:hypothetical protein